jgi:NAD(P)H-nitrite reductase large subunit
MLRLGEKGVIPQRDNETYAIAPHIPCGMLTPELLRRAAEVAEKYRVKAVKITGAARLAIIALKEEGAMAAGEKVIAFYAREAQKGERLGKRIDRIGIEPFKAVLA